MSVIYPWPTYTTEWDLTIDGLTIDGVDRLPTHVDHDHRVVTMPETWVEATLSFTASSDEVFRGEHVGAVLVLNSPRTFSRFSDTHEGEGPYSWTVPILHDDVAGAVDVGIEIVGTHNGHSRTVGHAGGWRIVVDSGRRPTPPGVPPVEFEWVDFRTATAPAVAQASPTQFAYVDLDGSEPRVYLNEGVAGLKEILYADTAIKERRLYRNAISSDLVAKIATALVRHAFALVDEDNPAESDLPVVYSSALDGVARAMNIDTTALIQDYVDAVKHTGQAKFWARVDVAIDQLTERAAAIADMAKESQK